MYIKSVIIDGFKSYGRRTEITGFDPEFNAITGLNGTGKSNILDSICFLLGISNLKNVRAENLQDLVYKNGQAGVTKATVTIVFDNKDRNNCPIGYERCEEITVTRQIVVGGKNKYLINGKNAQNKAVQDLFCSVQMNVNNPNFLIMQGRVTKVLNMNPTQILSMIEEAAGTSMYETKREKSLALIEKKESKLNELNALIKDDIEPKLDQLRQDKKRYIEYQNICRDIEYLTRITISFKYLHYQKAVQSSQQQIEKLTEKITHHNDKIKAHELEAEQIDERVKEIQHSMDTKSGGELSELEKQMEEMTKSDASLRAKLNTAKDVINSDERKIKTLIKNIQIDETAFGKKETEMQRMGGTFEQLKTAEEADKQAFLQAQKNFEAVSSGLTINEDGEATSLQDQLATAKSKASEATSKIKECEMELKHSTASLASKQKEVKTSDSAYLKDKEIIDKTQKEIQQLEQQLGQIQYQDGQMESLQDRQHELNQESRKLKQEVDRLGGHRWEFKYSTPSHDFDPRNVKGLVGNLIKVRNPKYSQALSVLAGGSLANVIVKDENTGKLLIQKGNLARRTTMMPLNKINGRTIPPHIVKLAQDLVGKDNVAPAISLIEYDSELEPAMKMIFGSSFVCTDMEVAKKVTYHHTIHTRSITLEGDVMDPEGTLSGGARATGNPLLDDLAKINSARAKLTRNDDELHNIESTIREIASQVDQYKKVKGKLDLLKMQLDTVQKRIHTTTFQQAQNEIDELKERLEVLKKTIEESREIQKQNQAKAKDIESKLKDAKGHREHALKEAEEAMKRAKKKSDDSGKNWKKREQEYETLKLEIEDLKKTIVQSKEQLEKMQEALAKAKEEYEVMSSANEEARTQHDALKQKIKEQKDKISQQNKEIKSKLHHKEKLLKNNQELLLDIKKCENEIVKVRGDNKDGYNKISDLEKKYPWILEDKDHFGTKNTRYDYSKEDPNQAGQKLHKLLEDKEKMSRGINEQAMMLLEKEEEHYKNLTIRRKKIEDDKRKIQEIIKNLDRQKREKLQEAWQDVNKNFGSIFSTLLPGTQAKLAAQDNYDIMKGLVVKIGFNGQWKEDLKELSGGQRSLVALSLVLAMLKFKPAPIYILDEVDAALDLSHTQNIGSMLKAHFTGSQFIVVSLKEGMFSNANVVFQTRFIDGMSGVIRTANIRN